MEDFLKFINQSYYIYEEFYYIFKFCFLIRIFLLLSSDKFLFYKLKGVYHL